MIQRCLAVFLAVTAVASTPAVSQWTMTAEVGAERFWGGSIEKSEEQRSFRPYRPTGFGIGLERRAGKLALGVGLRYSSAGLALEGSDGLSAVNGIFTVYSLLPELVYQISRLGSLNRLSLHAGPLLEFWSVLDEGSETRLGVQGALSMNVPLGGRFDGSVAAGAALISSPFGPTQLDPAFERRPLWRRRFAVGLAYRL